MNRRALLGGIAAIPLALSVFAQEVSAADQALIDAAKAEGSVVWYSGYLVNELLVPVAAAFEAKFGIPVEYARMNSADIILRLTNEAAAGKISVDVFDGSNLVSLYDAGLAQSFTPEAAGAYSAASVDPNGLWVAPNSNYMTLAYNTDLVGDNEVPLTLDALLDPKWKGQMAITNSLNPTGGPGFIGAVFAEKGEEAGLDYLLQLAAQEVRIVPANQKVVLDGAIAGEYPIALMTFNHHSVIAQDVGAPVAWARFDPVVASRTYVSVAQGSPHPNAGKLLVDFLMSKEGQQLFADAGYIPDHPEVPPTVAELRPDAGGFKTFDVTVDNLRDDLKHWTEVFKELFGA